MATVNINLCYHSHLLRSVKKIVPQTNSNSWTMLLFYTILIMSMLYMIQPQKPLNSDYKNVKLEHTDNYLVLALHPEEIRCLKV